METCHDQLIAGFRCPVQAGSGSGPMRTLGPMIWQSADALQCDRMISPQGSSVARVTHVDG
jgi:hypothetical protein